MNFLARFHLYTLDTDAVARALCADLFKDYDAGFSALKEFVRHAAQDRLKLYKQCTISSFFEVFAPASDGNNVGEFSLFVASRSASSWAKRSLSDRQSACDAWVRNCWSR